MVIIIPDEKNGIYKNEFMDPSHLINTLNFKTLSENSVHNDKVHLYLPKFKIETNIDLKPVLTKVSMH